MDQAEADVCEAAPQALAQVADLVRLVEGRADLDVGDAGGAEAGGAQGQEDVVVEVGAGGVVGLGEVEEDQVERLALVVEGLQAAGGVAEAILIENKMGRDA